MRIHVGLALMACLFVSACATSHEAAIPSDLKAQITNLERTQQTMRRQYENMGVTLVRLEQRIAQLKERAQREQTRPMTIAAAKERELVPPQPTAAPAREAVALPAPLPPPAAQPDSGKPIDLAAGVGELTDEDMQETAVASITPAPGKPVDDVVVAPRTPAQALNEPQTAVPQDEQKTEEPAAKPAAGGKVYLAHLASYHASAPVRSGWKELEAKYASRLAGLKPYVTSFEDNQGRKWLRLSAGPFSSGSDAHKACEALKAAGQWCEMLQAANGAARELR